jgi:hypothetical protein
MTGGIGITLAGMPLTGVDSSGAEWITTDMGGWGSPPSTLTPVQKTRAPGAWLSPRQLTPRTLSIGGMVRGASVATRRPETIRDALDRLAAAASIDGATLAVTEGGLTRSCTVYRHDELLVTWLTDSLAQWSLGLVAVDPRKYGAQIVASTGLPTTSGGLTFPVTFPVTYSGVSASGIVSINNPGNTTGPVTIRIDGPCTAPKIRHDGSGARMTVTTAPAYL